MEKVTNRHLDVWWADVECIAAALLEHDELSGAQVREIIPREHNLSREHRQTWAAWSEFMADK